MPRNGSGTYTLPVNSFNPAVNNTVIDPSDWNDTATDLTTAITDSLDRSGEGGMLANLDMGTHSVTNAGPYNKVTITAPATGSTLTIADGKTLTASVTVTLTGTDATSFAFPSTSGTIATIAATQTFTNKTITATSNVLGGVTMTLGSDATGDMYYRDSGGHLARLGIGTNGQVLGVTAGALAWQAAASAGSITVGSTTIASGTTGRILYDNGGTLGEIALGATVANSLGGDVNLSSTGTYFDGPSCAQGTSGTWLATGTVCMTDTVVAAAYQVKLWDGTTVIASAQMVTTVANSVGQCSLSGVLASPAANIKISVKDISATTGKILFNSSGNSKDSTLTVVRIG